MCGIAVAVGTADRSAVERMLDRLAHRGPDGRGLHLGDGVALGHQRLAIIDPAGGQQPLAGDGVTVVANGMIYNDRDLRARLGPSRYRTGSDSESILHAHRRFGDEAAGRLDGMFAFVAADSEGVVAARDPVGIKPLYVGRGPGGVRYLASEVKALTPVADEVEVVPPGHTWRPGEGASAYYRLPEPQVATLSPGEAARAVRRDLEEAVVKRLRSDVPLGCFLSGGLDSSAIAALARRHLPELHTFSVGLAGSPDLAAARRVARHLETRHHEHVVAPDEIARHLPEILYHLESYDRDLVRSAVPTFFVARAAARHVKVVLTGEGADELFAGYRYHGRFDTGAALQRELHRSVASLHGLNLQRVDRMTMAHGLEARVPFLDPAMIELAMRIPAAAKRRTVGSRVVAKWVLREAVADLLPDDITWRGKAQFADGSGFGRLLAELAGAGSPDPAVTEQARYRRLLADAFPDPAPVLALTEHWRGRDAATTAPAGS